MPARIALVIAGLAVALVGAWVMLGAMIDHTLSAVSGALFH